MKFTNLAEHIARNLKKGRKTQNGWVACCPAHEDENPSLSITNAEDRVLVHCFAGCSQETVIDALKLLHLWETDFIEGTGSGLSKRELLELPPFDPANLIKKKEVAWYDYTDEENRLLYQVIRYEPKSFRQRRPDHSGGWINSMGDVRRVPYRLPKVLAAIISGLPILIVEGEKDVHAAESIGCVATCNAMGADTGSGTKWLSEFADYFIGADVIIIPDQDVPGEKHAHHVAKTLSNKARSIRIANPPVLCKDLADWVERGASLAEIESHAELIYAEEEIPRKNIFTHVGDPFQSMKPIDWLVKDYFEHDSLTQLFGEPGSGKSFIALSLACCVATGTPWFGKEVKQGAVFYICGEGHAGLLRRFGAWSKEMGVPLDMAPIYKSDHQVSLSERDNAKYLLEDIMMLKETHQVSPRLIVIDTVARNFGPADENSTKDMSNFIENVDRYVRIPFKANVLLVHHSGHAGGRARGSSALKAALDSEYMVNKDEDFVTLTPTKMKDAELPTSLTLQFKKVELGEYDGEAVSSAVLISLVDTPNLRIGSKLNGDGIHVVDCLNYIYQGWESSEDAKNKLSCSSKTLTECMEKLTSRHLVYKNVVGKYELSTSGHSLLTTTGINLVPKIDNYHFKGSTD